MDAQNVHRGRTAKPAFRLLDLPPELRNNVYQYVIEKFERKSKQERRCRHVRGAFAQIPRQIISFLLSCKTIWRELLSLLFGSYIWTADLRIQNLELGTMSIVPTESWLLSPSTWRKPTSGNIRHVQLKIDRKGVSSAHSNVCPGWYFTLNVDLMKSAPYFASTVQAHINGSEYMNGGGRRIDLRDDLEKTIKESLTQLESAKLRSCERLTSITVEEWQEIAMSLKATYLRWLRTPIPN